MPHALNMSLARLVEVGGDESVVPGGCVIVFIQIAHSKPNRKNLQFPVPVHSHNRELPNSIHRQTMIDWRDEPPFCYATIVLTRTFS